MKILKEYFKDYKNSKKAIGHFNFSTADQLRAIVEAAQDAGEVVMVGTSEGEAGFIGYRQAVALVKSYFYQGMPVFLNADHHKTFESAKEAIDAGYDTVLFDGSSRSLEENIALTKQVVEYGRSINPDMMIEGELGYLRGSSEVQKSIQITPDDYTKPEDLESFIRETGVDRMGIVFGNIHGIVTEQKEMLDIEHLKKLSPVAGDCVLVLHGASGIGDDQIREAIKNGISNVHFNTELRVAYRHALDQSLNSDKDETTPAHYLEPAFEAVKKVISEKLKLF